MKKEDKKALYMWGTIAGLWIFILFVIQEQTAMINNVQTKSFFNVFQYLGLGVCIYIPLRKYKANNDNLISFGRCVFNSVLISAMSGIVVALCTFIYFTAVPSTKQNIVSDSETFLVNEHQKDAKTIQEYKTWVMDSIDNSQSTISEKEIKKSQADSTIKVMELRMERVNSSLGLSGLILTYTPIQVLMGMIFSIFIAAVISNKKPQ